MEDRQKSDPQSLEGVRGDLYDHSVPGGGDGMAYAYGQCTWGVAARMNQLGLKLKVEMEKRFQSLIPWEMVRTGLRQLKSWR